MEHNAAKSVEYHTPLNWGIRLWPGGTVRHLLNTAVFDRSMVQDMLRGGDQAVELLSRNGAASFSARSIPGLVRVRLSFYLGITAIGKRVN